jgi:hypothetical protein
LLWSGLTALPLFAQGGITSGWTFYVKDGKLTTTHNFIDAVRYRVTSTQPVPTDASRTDA